MTDTITELDALAIACIERPNDYAAWASLCDYCEENGLRFHPRALAWVLKNRGYISNRSSEATVDDRTETLAYGQKWEALSANPIDSGSVERMHYVWANPLFKKVTA